MASLTTKPKPRVASNHFTRPTTAVHLGDVIMFGGSGTATGAYFRLGRRLGSSCAAQHLTNKSQCVVKPT